MQRKKACNSSEFNGFASFCLCLSVKDGSIPHLRAQSKVFLPNCRALRDASLLCSALRRDGFWDIFAFLSQKKLRKAYALRSAFFDLRV